MAQLQLQIPAGWEDIFALYFGDDTRPPHPCAAALWDFVTEAYKTEEIYPPRAELFRAFAALPPERVRVVILGQDPYHEPRQAHGLSFSVPEGVKLPPSLRNIFKELYADLGMDSATPPPTSGDLSGWAEQGVLLLNSVLTVRRGAAGSHRGLGWEQFTDAVLHALSLLDQPMAFVLWGKDARAKRPLIAESKVAHLILEADHPSPLSAWRGFFGSKPFSAINAYLIAQGKSPIAWIK